MSFQRKYLSKYCTHNFYNIEGGEQLSSPTPFIITAMQWLIKIQTAKQSWRHWTLSFIDYMVSEYKSCSTSLHVDCHLPICPFCIVICDRISDKLFLAVQLCNERRYLEPHFLNSNTRKHQYHRLNTFWIGQWNIWFSVWFWTGNQTLELLYWACLHHTD